MSDAPTAEVVKRSMAMAREIVATTTRPPTLSKEEEAESESPDEEQSQSESAREEVSS